ncbi:hypothetical protein VRU48_13335 [Pedobacter sp. KR3-3]|uniref:DUF748 domain-containing protein n=1 Tax=Pedobacter albus TaxID=3113905 RepID=A0ABU7I9R2_9SPHI|nr:hypothetical protein [Pedobacter sp. KR3-3]MEE1946099.1 hypothetical protein [Pedobacter sp. KR3-3]
MPTKKRNFKKIAWWIGGVFLLLMVLLGGAAIYLSQKWKPLLSNKLKAGVAEASNRLYRIDFKDVHLNLLSGNAVLDSITLSPDTNVYNQLKLQKKAPTHLFRIKLAQLKLSRVGILGAYFNKRINMDAIVLDHPSIDMIYHKVAKREVKKDDRTLYQQISKSIKSIKIGRIKVVDADFDYYNGAKKLNAIKHLTINVRDVLIDSLADQDSTRVLYAKDVGFALNGYQSVAKDKMYTLKVDTLEGSISSKTLKIRGLKVIPMYPDLAFSRMYKEQKDRYDLNFKAINLSGIDFIGLNNDGELHVKKLELGPAKVGVFMNRELPPPNFDKGRNYPHVAIKRLPIQTLVDTLQVNQVDVAYTEYNPQAQERGTVRLENLSGNILNVTNDSTRLLTHGHALADLTTYVMGKGKMNVKIDFDLNAADAAFAYTGTVGPFNLQVLNPLSKSLGLIEIESGQVQKVDFAVKANVRRSNGSMHFYYTGLKVKLLKKDDDGQQKKKGLLSFLANTLLIKDDNPSKGEALRTAKIAYERVPQASFFNLMWKGIFTGMRETAGIGIVPMKKMPNPKSGPPRAQGKKERETPKKKAKS